MKKTRQTFTKMKQTHVEEFIKEVEFLVDGIVDCISIVVKQYNTINSLISYGGFAAKVIHEGLYAKRKEEQSTTLV